MGAAFDVSLCPDSVAVVLYLHPSPARYLISLGTQVAEAPYSPLGTDLGHQSARIRSLSRSGVAAGTRYAACGYHLDRFRYTQRPILLAVPALSSSSGWEPTEGGSHSAPNRWFQRTGAPHDPAGFDRRDLGGSHH